MAHDQRQAWHRHADPSVDAAAATSAAAATRKPAGWWRQRREPRTARPELIHEYSQPVVGPDEAPHAARIYGVQRQDGTWVGWLAFTDLSSGITLRTERETTQPNRTCLEYWTSGLEPLYLEGALARARRRGGLSRSSTAWSDAAGGWAEGTTAGRPPG
jgi:hypothetical protein